MLHLIAHILGTDNVSGAWYAWWSGAGSDLAYLSVFAAAFGMYRKNNCRMRWCWRLGRHEYTDPHHVTRLLCWRHHPGVTHKQLTRERLHLYLGGKPGKG